MQVAIVLRNMTSESPKNLVSFHVSSISVSRVMMLLGTREHDKETTECLFPEKQLPRDSDYS